LNEYIAYEYFSTDSEYFTEAEYAGYPSYTIAVSKIESLNKKTATKPLHFLVSKSLLTTANGD
jgi:hypothetical protein